MKSTLLKWTVIDLVFNYCQPSASQDSVADYKVDIKKKVEFIHYL